MRSPTTPLPASVVRWTRRAQGLRALDAVAAWLLIWTGTTILVREVDKGALAVVAAVLTTGVLVAAPLRRRWCPVTGLFAFVLSRRLRPGDRAWRIAPNRAELVVVTARRGWRAVIVTTTRDPVEGIVVRRTRTLLIPASGGSGA